jgi:uncharacterized protein YpuA (DUF1002 family)
MKATLLNQLRSLQEKLREHEIRIETGVDAFENGKAGRDSKRKEILLHEVKQILSNLHETDKKQVKDLKSDVFDQLRAVAKVEKETARLVEVVKTASSHDLDTMEEAVNEVNQRVEELQLEAFSRYLLAIN